MLRVESNFADIERRLKELSIESMTETWNFIGNVNGERVEIKFYSPASYHKFVRALTLFDTSEDKSGLFAPFVVPFLGCNVTVLRAGGELGASCENCIGWTIKRLPVRPIESPLSEVELLSSDRDFAISLLKKIRTVHTPLIENFFKTVDLHRGMFEDTLTDG